MRCCAEGISEIKYKIKDADIGEYLNRLRAVFSIKSVQQVEDVIKSDPPDNLVLACAVEVKVDYLVSGNVHFLELKEHRGIKMVSPSQFLEILSSI